MKKLVLALACAAALSAQQIRINPLTGLPDLVGTSGGGGNIPFSNITDLKPTMSSGTVVDVSAGNYSVGNTFFVVAACTFTITGGSGNGTVLGYITAAAVVAVEHPTAAGLTITASSGCVQQQVTTPAIPPNAKQLFSATVVGGSFTALTDARAPIYSDPATAGTGITINQAAGVRSVAIDTAVVPTLAGPNPFTGPNDFTTGDLFQPRGSGAPSSALCDASAEVGRVYVNTDNGGLAYDCMQTGSGVYGWVPRGGGSFNPSGQTLARLLPLGNEPPAANFALFAVRNARPILTFIDSSDTNALWSFVMPNSYGGGGTTVEIEAAAVPTSGTVMFCAAWEWTETGTLDIDSDSFATANCSSAVTVPGTSGVTWKSTISFSNGSEMDSCPANGLCRLKTYRDVSEDDAAGLAQILSVTVREQ